MKNKHKDPGSRPTQLTIAFGESNIIRAVASDGTGSTQTHSGELQAKPVKAPQWTPTGARESSERTSKTERRRKWYSLWDKVYAPANLQRAWEKVQSNGGAGGIDGLTIEMFARKSEIRLDVLSRDLQAKTYRPQAVRRVDIPKAGGGTRPLGIPTIHDRIVQQALLQVLNPIFDPLFSDRSHGFRPGRGTHTALNVVDRAISHGYSWMVDADIQGFFNNVDHELLLTAINEEVSDGSVLRLIRAILTAGVVHPGVTEMDPTELGTPQGGPLSPLLANIYLHRMDRAMEGRFNLVRYADDFVIFARSESEAEAALACAREILEGDLKLTLHPGKTRLVTVDAGFTFLGFHYFRRNEKLYIKTPSRTAMHRLRAKVRQLTPRIRNQTKPKKRSLTRKRLAQNQRLGRMVSELNRYLTSWFGYFRMASLPRSTAFDSVDGRVRARLRIALTGRVGKGWWTVALPNAVFHEHLGLVSLQQRYAALPRHRVLCPRPGGLISMESRLR